MFRAIGFLIVLWGMSHFFAQTFSQLDSTATESLKAIEIAATSMQQQLR